MKILLLAPVHRELEFLKQKNNAPFVMGQGQQGWYEALQDLGHHVAVFRYTDSYFIPNTLKVYVSHFFQTYLPVWRARFIRFGNKIHIFGIENKVKNYYFERLVERFLPDLIMVSGGLSGVYPKTLKQLKEINRLKLILLSGVNPTYGASEYDKQLVQYGILDGIFINDFGYGINWRKMGAKKVEVLPIAGADVSIHKKVRLSKQEYEKLKTEICFIGTLSYDRQHILKHLVGFRPRIWGDIPPKTEIIKELRPFYEGKAHGEKMVHIYNASKIVVNIHALDMRYGGNMKTFEIPACGAFQLLDTMNSKWFQNGKEVVLYKDSKDLVKKIKYYLTHEEERKKIAEKGYKRVRKDHTYKAHMNKLLNIVYEK